MTQGKTENHIDYIELPATDIPATKQFYSTLFGWTFSDFGPDYSSFFDGRNRGGFTRDDAAVTPRGVLLVIYARDLEALQDRIRQAGGKIVRDTFSFPGGRRFHFSDPNGNELAAWSDLES